MITRWFAYLGAFMLLLIGIGVFARFTGNNSAQAVTKSAASVITDTSDDWSKFGLAGEITEQGRSFSKTCLSAKEGDTAYEVCKAAKKPIFEALSAGFKSASTGALGTVDAKKNAAADQPRQPYQVDTALTRRMQASQVYVPTERSSNNGVPLPGGNPNG